MAPALVRRLVPDGARAVPGCVGGGTMKHTELPLTCIMFAMLPFSSHTLPPSQSERMKALLVSWLERVKSPYLDEVKARPIAQKDR